MSEKVSIKQSISTMLKLQDQGRYATLLGIGPMSPNLLRASFELAKDDDFPLMFIASRNQVDKDDLGGGYVNGWDQTRFSADIKKVADAVGFNGLYYLCRDHGGPWQRDKERNSHLKFDEAMKLAKESYLADIEAGFDLLMIDPTKDPFQIGKVVNLDNVIDWTVELIDYCETERKKRNLPEIGYEVGTEETNGGLTTTAKYENFIQRLKSELDKRNLPMPTLIVGQTGTLTRIGVQAGEWNFENAVELGTMAKKYGVGLKEHNADYLDDVTLLLHQPAHITACNVAPQYGTAETHALIHLTEVEQQLVKHGLVENPSNLYNVLLDKAIRNGRWTKWMEGDDDKLTVDQALNRPDLYQIILDVAGHYVYNEPEVKAEVAKLYANLSENNINGQRYVIDRIKDPLRQYVETLNLTGLTSDIRKNVAQAQKA
ncbi:class II D-tagatose-bisphosphate aldolase non-catalytic subunit [Levilactobacillus huananensis]|uniref:class II D-tagatose-bisphosphate aldolase non-catalytic subunit n=1 Tax=Levilactobacillus huananensis TaxID=2486019 RepID=UPI000F7B0730|nr:class II D-tagatose-bisphosphate aldolase, non-catalytic subunit [Levilactobacillus huananensis]